MRPILADHEIYFARPDQFNDKTELHIRHEITGDEYDPGTRLALLADLERIERRVALVGREHRQAGNQRGGDNDGDLRASWRHSVCIADQMLAIPIQEVVFRTD